MAFAPPRCRKIGDDAQTIKALTLFLEAHAKPPKRTIVDSDATDDSPQGHPEECVLDH